MPENRALDAESMLTSGMRKVAAFSAGSAAIAVAVRRFLRNAMTEEGKGFAEFDGVGSIEADVHVMNLQ